MDHDKIKTAIRQAVAKERARCVRAFRAGWRPPDIESGLAFRRGGLVIALQYWAGDEKKALDLARVIADIEPHRRSDVVLAFCRRRDCPVSQDLWDAIMHCGRKMPTMVLASRREGVGHPAGCNDLWAGTMDALVDAWYDGRIRFESVFLAEADGAPLSHDWIDRMIAAHRTTLRVGKRITGALMESHYTPHVNGNMIAHMSLWNDRQSLHRTPPDRPWDVFHAQVLMHEARASRIIANEYGSVRWSVGTLRHVADESAWMHGCKDGSVLAFAKTLIPVPFEEAYEKAKIKGSL